MAGGGEPETTAFDGNADDVELTVLITPAMDALDAAFVDEGEPFVLDVAFERNGEPAPAEDSVQLLLVNDIHDVTLESELEEIDGRRRAGVVGDGIFVTPADASATVAIVDMETRDVTEVDVETGVDTVQYVGDSGMGYSSR